MKYAFVKIPCGLLLAGAALAATMAPIHVANAQEAPAVSPVSLTSEVKIERHEVDSAGQEKATLYTPSQIAVVPGDKVIFTLEVANKGPQAAAGFRAVNPMPSAVQFVSVAEDWAEVSVDGGATWGKLGELKIQAKAADGIAVAERAAGPEDVTHVRWAFADEIAPGSKRTISYRGVVK